MEEKNEILVIYTTVNSEEDAKKLAKGLVEGKLAACVSYTKVKSNYYWEGKVVEDDEYLLIIKTSRSKKLAIATWLQENHPYSVPEILFLDAESSESYYRWLTDYLGK